jgi:hypothetical protein
VTGVHAGDPHGRCWNLHKVLAGIFQIFWGPYFLQLKYTSSVPPRPNIIYNATHAACSFT